MKKKYRRPNIEYTGLESFKDRLFVYPTHALFDASMSTTMRLIAKYDHHYRELLIILVYKGTVVAESSYFASKKWWKKHKHFIADKAGWSVQ